MPEKENPSAAAQRAALYIRVSTEEQAMHGYSLAAQRESLTRYAKAHNLSIVDYYVDAADIIGANQKTLTQQEGR